jgi:hypothetical protein
VPEERYRVAEREGRLGLAVGQGDAADVEVTGVEVMAGAAGAVGAVGSGAAGRGAAAQASSQHMPPASAVRARVESLQARIGGITSWSCECYLHMHTSYTKT